MKYLGDYPLDDRFEYPPVSIIFAARNEARNIEEATLSLLNLDYPSFEIIAVNDRSTDSTGKILETISESSKALKVLNVNELPAGWLGKNHALFIGAKASKHEIILFTDADIVFEKSALKKAIQCFTQGKWDHLTLTPHTLVPGFLLNLCVGVFGMLFFSFIRPWKAQDPKSKYFLGVGAFNLIKRSTYQKIGTFEALKMRPDDDVKLGKLVKLKGGRQLVLLGKNSVQVEWYSTFKEFVHGLEKNVYSGIDYRFFFMVLSTIAMILIFLVPYFGVFMTKSPTSTLFGLSILLQVICYLSCSQIQGLPLYTVFAFPVGILLYVYVIWNAILKCHFHKGLTWRNTFYSLEELKKNKIE